MVENHMRLPLRCTFLVLFVILLALAIAGQETIGQPSQVVEARTRLIEAFQSVQGLDFQGVSSSETGKLVEQLNSALADLRRANETESDSDATLSTEKSSQVLAAARTMEAVAERQTNLIQLTGYSVAIVTAALSSLIIVDIDMLERIVRRKKVVEG